MPAQNVRRQRRRSHGVTLLGWLLLIPAAVLAVLLIYLGFVAARKAYWDYRVEELCEKEGGVRIFERVRIQEADIATLPLASGRLSVSSKELAHPAAPVYAVSETVKLRDYNPEVLRIEQTVIRRVDGKAVARYVHFVRIGGDLPIPIMHPSTFGCPDLRRVSADLAQLFMIEGAAK